MKKSNQWILLAWLILGSVGASFAHDCPDDPPDPPDQRSSATATRGDCDDADGERVRSEAGVLAFVSVRPAK